MVKTLQPQMVAFILDSGFHQHIHDQSTSMAGRLLNVLDGRHSYITVMMNELIARDAPIIYIGACVTDVNCDAYG